MSLIPKELFFLSSMSFGKPIPLSLIIRVKLLFCEVKSIEILFFSRFFLGKAYLSELETDSFIIRATGIAVSISIKISSTFISNFTNKESILYDL